MQMKHLKENLTRILFWCVIIRKVLCIINPWITDAQKIFEKYFSFVLLMQTNSTW